MEGASCVGVDCAIVEQRASLLERRMVASAETLEKFIMMQRQKVFRMRRQPVCKSIQTGG